ncbi:MAG TPA: dTDP-4-amino-4,6-dideoxygalactose transaminase [Prolixibacteraceae bacterium]
MSIVFNKPCLVGKELEYMKKAIENGHISGDGEFTKKCHSLLESQLGCKKVLLTTSCTHALEMAALLLDIQSGDEVIVPSFTFVSTVNAFVLRGAFPRFIDCRPDTLNMDETKLEKLITKKTKAILPVHYAGVGCEMDEISSIAQSKHIAIVEDNAHGLFGKYRGKYLGTFGTFATQSFHETKNFTSGEGGALLINDSQYIEQAEIIREKGTNRSRFFRGIVDKYSWVSIGSSYLPSDILGGFLFAQLENWQKIQAKREHIWSFYNQNLKSWSEKEGVRLPIVPSGCDQSFHMFYLLLPNLETRSAMIKHLKDRGVEAVFHYLPLHLSDMGLHFGGKPGDCPITERISDQLLRLPFFYDLSDNDLEQIVDAVIGFHI